jgi:glycosyltransferase involved in cell wall biosynthesis
LPSIIIPAYNSEKNIYSLAEDLIKIFNENVNLIIVNDFSVDGTHDECIKILDKFKKNV